MSQENKNPFDTQKKLRYAKNVIAIASGKGGVGKSTVAANLALSLKEKGFSVGLLDLDLYGPSVPIMFGQHKPTESVSEQGILPAEKYGIQIMSLGFFLESNAAVIWRGPLVIKAVDQLLNEVFWKQMDYLIIDLPPGTGDIQLTLAQRIPTAGAVIVTTPQDIALLDARKALHMFRKVDVPVLGVVENMSTHICTACGHEEAIFGQGGGEQMAKDFEIPLLGQLPLAMEIRSSMDAGEPTVAHSPDSPSAMSYRAMALRTAGALAILPRSMAFKMPEIVVSN